MRITVDHRRRRQLPEGGPWLLWRQLPPSRGGGREGLVLVLAACNNRQCQCREVKVQGFRVRDDLAGVELGHDGGLSLYYPQAEPSPSPQPDGGVALVAWIEFESGELGLEDTAKRSHGAAELLAWLRSEVDGEVLDGLYDVWLAGKGWKRRDQPDWQILRSTEPGALACWQEAFPDERPDVFLLRDGAFVVRDVHCIAPRCDCTKSRLIVFEMLERENREVGTVGVDFLRGTAVDFEALTVPKAVLRRVWRAYAARHQVAQRLRTRKQRLTELGQQVDRSSAPAPAPPQTRAAVKIGRNQPCPCGSGKKYKHCCGRPGR